MGGGSDFALCVDLVIASEDARIGTPYSRIWGNTPDAKSFIELAERQGVPAAVAERDGPFGDYSQAPPESKPDPNNVIEP